MTNDSPSDLPVKLRHVPVQDRSRDRLRRVLDAADRILSDEGARAFTTSRIAEVAEVPVGSVYRYFADKEAIVEALALRYWSDFADLVCAVAETDERDPLPDPGGAVLQALAAGFRAHQGFLSLWFGGLRSERIRDVTRPTRTAITHSIQRILAVHWPQAGVDARGLVAQMVVIAGDGLLREAFRVSAHGDQQLLTESAVMLDAYIVARLGDRRA